MSYSVNSIPELSCEAILAHAERASGAFGLSQADLQGRLAKLISEINKRGPYSPDQAETIRRQLHFLLVNRLGFELDRQQFPAIENEVIERPIFVVGFPRSGTSLLHALLAEDPEALSLRAWNQLQPSPPPGAGPVCKGRIAIAQRRIEDMVDFYPEMLRLHPYTDKGAWLLSEDEEIFGFDLRNVHPTHLYRIHTQDVGMIMLDADPAGAYRFHKRFLQQFQWNTGKSRWICKGPSHQHQLEALFDTYPDAICIWPHRPIEDMYSSDVAVRAMVYDAINGRPNDWASQARAFAQGMKGAVERLMANAMIDDPRIVHVDFRALSAEPVETIKTIYRRFNLEVTQGFEAGMQAWLADPENAVNRYGRYPYSYEAYGLDKEWIKELFADYRARFNLGA